MDKASANGSRDHPWLVDKADTHKQDGASWNVSASLKNFAKAGWDAISSLGFGVKGGDSSKVAGGKAEFSCPGVEGLCSGG